MLYLVIVLFAPKLAPVNAEGTENVAATGKTTEALDFNDPSTYTPTTQNFSRSSYVLDAFEELTSIEFINDPAWAASGPWQILTSVDGAAFTLQETISSFPAGSQTYTSSFPARYWRFSRPGATPAFGNITSTNAPILERARTTFPNSLIWIKDRANSNNWQLACSQYDVAPTDNVVLTNTTGYQPYTAPTGSSVAYCWDLTDPAKSGCQFISDTGTGSQRTVSHNLGRVSAGLFISLVESIMIQSEPSPAHFSRTRAVRNPV